MFPDYDICYVCIDLSIHIRHATTIITLSLSFFKLRIYVAGHLCFSLWLQISRLSIQMVMLLLLLNL